MSQVSVTVIARLQAKKGMEAQVRRECVALIAPSRKEEGCISYDLYQSTDDPTVFIFFENWLSREHVEKHLEMPHCLKFDQRTQGMLARPEEITFLEKVSSL
jgi:quinol monooxygenase YgiN